MSPLEELFNRIERVFLRWLPDVCDSAMLHDSVFLYLFSMSDVPVVLTPGIWCQILCLRLVCTGIEVFVQIWILCVCVLCTDIVLALNLDSA